MTIPDVLRILYPGVQGFLSAKQASNLVLSLILLAIEPIDVDTLRFLARFFTPTDYDELVQERTVESRCGYPVCPAQLTDHFGKARSCPSQHTVFAWSRNYCSRHCLRSSQFYRRQLSTEVLTTRRDVAFAPYGHLKYETEILILSEVESYAKLHRIELVQAISALLSAGDVVKSLQNLTIEIPAGADEDMEIQEKNVGRVTSQEL